MRFSLFPILVVGVILAFGCNKNATPKVSDQPFDPSTYENYGPEHPNPMVAKRTLENGEQSHIAIQHILIGFSGSVENSEVTRSREEAKTLAEDVFAQAKAGKDFDALVEFYTDDKIPGIYKLANHSVAGQQKGKDKSQWVWERADMVPGFGDVGFGLEVGEIGISEYDPVKSKLGWHIIKRVE